MVNPIRKDRVMGSIPIHIITLGAQLFLCSYLYRLIGSFSSISCIYYHSFTLFKQTGDT
jgi:hypothetical protein